MKNTIIYSVIFVTAFIGTTFSIYTLNNKYANMFQFDFRDAKTVAIADSLAGIESDSVAVVDSVNIEDKLKEKAHEYKEDLSITKKELIKSSEEIKKKEEEISRLKQQLELQSSAERDEWLKATIKLYEEMEVAKAREILKKLPEDDAREIVYSMKKKKAAEILSSLDIETVKRLTRAKK